jgi:Zn-dependent metalloprotease
MTNVCAPTKHFRELQTVRGWRSALVIPLTAILLASSLGVATGQLFDLLSLEARRAPQKKGLIRIDEDGSATGGQGNPILNMKITNQDFHMAFPSDSTISFNAQWGTVRFLKSSNLTRDLEHSTEFQSLQAANQYKEIVFQFLHAYRVSFKLTNPLEELVVHSIQADDLGFHQVRLKQMVMGIPVWGAEILVQLDRANHVNLVQGHYYPSPQGLDLHPELTAEAVQAYVAAHLNLPDSSCQACTTSLVVFFIVDAHSPRLAYSVRTPIGLVEGWNFIVDAETGDILQKIPTVFTQ